MGGGYWVRGAGCGDGRLGWRVRRVRGCGRGGLGDAE